LEVEVLGEAGNAEEIVEGMLELEAKAWWWRAMSRRGSWSAYYSFSLLTCYFIFNITACTALRAATLSHDIPLKTYCLGAIFSFKDIFSWSDSCHHRAKCRTLNAFQAVFERCRLIHEIY
jgi:hypothetical protein